MPPVGEPVELAGGGYALVLPGGRRVLFADLADELAGPGTSSEEDDVSGNCPSQPRRAKTRRRHEPRVRHDHPVSCYLAAG